MNKKINRVAVSGGIMWGGVMFLSTIAAVYSGYAVAFLNCMASIYPGYSISPIGAFVGFFYGFLDVYLGTYIFVLIYKNVGK